MLNKALFFAVNLWLVELKSYHYGDVRLDAPCGEFATTMLSEGLFSIELALWKKMVESLEGALDEKLVKELHF